MLLRTHFYRQLVLVDLNTFEALRFEDVCDNSIAHILNVLLLCR